MEESAEGAEGEVEEEEEEEEEEEARERVRGRWAKGPIASVARSGDPV